MADFVSFSIRSVDQTGEMYFSESGSMIMDLTDINSITGEFEFIATGSRTAIQLNRQELNRSRTAGTAGRGRSRRGAVFRL
jgi:hypothetical protein